MLRVLAGGAAILATSVAAFAADLPNGASGPGLLRGETAYNWSGVYAGLSGGIAWNQLSDPNVTQAVGRVKNSGYVGGAQIGFNKQLDRYVIGLEADFSFVNARSQKSGTPSGKYGDYTIQSGSATMESALNNIGSVRVRAGYAFDNVLLYATGGYAFGRNRLGFGGDLVVRGGVPAKNYTAAQVGSGSNTANGWAAGGGIEWAFVRGSSLKLEYMRVHLNDSAFFNGTWAETRVSSDIDLIRAGFNFRI